MPFDITAKTPNNNEKPKTLCIGLRSGQSSILMSPFVPPKKDPSTGSAHRPRSDSVTRRGARKQWTKEEDQALMDIMKHVNPAEPVAWPVIAEAVDTGRTSKQCRDRWITHLRPGIKKGKWTVEEELLLKEMYENFGPKWSAMAKIITNRTDNDLKNKWHSMQRKQKRIEEKFRAELAIQLKRGDESAKSPPPAADSSKLEAV